MDLGRGMNFTLADLQALVAAGGYRTLCEASIRQKEDQCRARNAPSPFMSGVGSSSTNGPTGPISKSSGMTRPENASEALARAQAASGRSEEHTSELQSLMRNSYAVLCLKKKIY